MSDAENTIKACRELTEQWRQVVVRARTRLAETAPQSATDREYGELWEKAYALERQIRDLHFVLHRILDIEPDMYDPRTAPDLTTT